MARRKTAKSKSTKRKTTSQKTQKSTRAGIPPQRRMDIIGIILLVIGLLTIISLFTKGSSAITDWVVWVFSEAIGWGVYILPVLLIVFGLWMLLRNIERIPHLSPERVVGAILLILNILAWFQLINEEQGGGKIGAWILSSLEKTLGKPGAVIALIAWLIISLILSFDLSMASVIKALGNAIKKIADEIGTAIKKEISRSKLRKQAKQAKEQELEQNKPAAVSDSNEQPIKQKSGEAKPAAGTGDPNSLYYNHMPVRPVWVLPNPEDILDPAVKPPDDTENDRQRARVIEETLRSFGAPSHVVEIRRGPTITLFGVEPDFIESRNGKTRVRVSKITSLADDLALALAASRIRIQAPVPGKGYIGIEVPNQQVALVTLQEVITSTAFNKLNSPLKIALGKDVAGNTVAADLTKMPHLLIAGTTGAGKSVCINDILGGFLLNKTPDELRLVLVDPKRVELTGYNGIPHLLSPVIVDAEHVVGALQWMLREMDSRYRKFSESHTRNIADFNAHCEKTGDRKLPYILVVIDELADLMLLAPDETERAITRLAQLARATGIHLIIATQRPSTDILTGLIKANFPARIAFAVASSVDSRVILDQPGAERLLGRGDMLFQAPDAPAPVRIQTAFISDNEINRLASYWRSFTVSGNAPERPDQPAAFQVNKGVHLKQEPLWEEFEEEEDLDDKFHEAVEIVRAEGQASISMLQRKMRIGYTRAARMIDTMEAKGIISEPDPKTQIRQILDNSDNS